MTSSLVPAKRLGHIIRLIGGYRCKFRFFRKRDAHLYFGFNIFLIVEVGYMQPYIICLSEIIVETAVTKYAIKSEDTVANTFFLENKTVSLYFGPHILNSQRSFYGAIYDLFVGICCGNWCDL